MLDQLLPCFFNLISFLPFCTLLAFVVMIRSFNRQAVSFILLIVGITSILTVRSYLIAPQRIYANTDHHIVEHLGFRFGKILHLVNQLDPKTALWDKKKGQLHLQYDVNQQRMILISKGFDEPIYVKQLNSETYKIGNPTLNQPIKNQFSVVLNDSISFEITIQDDIDNMRSQYIYNLNIGNKSYKNDTLPFVKYLKSGYSLGSLLRQSNTNFPYFSQITNQLDDILLIREKVFLNGNTESSPLLLFLTNNVKNSIESISIDNKVMSFSNDPIVQIDLQNQQRFFFGIYTKRTKIYKTERYNGKASFLLDFPDKKYLKSTDDNEESLFITSSADDISNSRTLAGYYFAWMDDEQNQNHFTANLSYKSGSTREKLNLKLVNVTQNSGLTDESRSVKTGDTISVSTSNPLASVDWLFKVSDLKEENYLKFWHIVAMIFFMVFSSLSIIYIIKSDDWLFHIKKNKTLNTEVVIYIILICFFTVRSIILWRTSTFLPLDDITPQVYYKLQHISWNSFIDGCLALLFFYGVIFIWKIFGKRISQYIYEKYVSKQQKGLLFNKFWFIAFAFYTLPLFLKLFTSSVAWLERIASVFLPVFVYISLDIWGLYRTYKTEQYSTKSKKYYLFSAINWILCLLILTKTDAGFAIVFFIFSIVYWYLKLLTYPDYQLPDKQNFITKNKRYWILFIPPMVMLFALLGTPYLISHLFRSPSILFYLGAPILSYYGYLLFLNYSNLKRSMLSLSIFVLMISVGFWGETYIQNIIKSESRILYRAEVLINDPDEIIENEEFKSNLGNDSKLLEAAQNQWIVNYFYSKGSLGFYKYFKVEPHFQNGSPHLTQIADIVAVRYIIAEHSEWVIKYLISILLLLVLCTIRNTNFNIFSKIRVQLATLLFTVAFCIWLAATNRMVFVGQDFPLLSMNSRLTLLFTFSILLTIIILGNLTENKNLSQRAIQFNSHGRFFFGNIIAFIISLMALIYTFLPFEKNTRKFDLDNTILNLQASFNDLNKEFIAFQYEEKMNSSDVYQIVAHFDSYLKQNGEYRFFKDKNTFFKSAYFAFRDKLSIDNKAENLIHVVKNQEGMYEFTVNKFFYNINSPEEYLNVWQGDLLALTSTKSWSISNVLNPTNQVIIKNDIGSITNNLIEKKIIPTNENLNLEMFSLPSSWSADSLPITFINSTVGEMKTTKSNFIIKNGSDVYDSKQNRMAVRLLPDDFIQFIPLGSDEITTLRYRQINQDFLSKNVWLNGKKRFFYPLKERFLWCYHFSQLMKSIIDKQIANGNTVNQNKPIKTSIDANLTYAISISAQKHFNKFEKQLIGNLKKGDSTDSKRAFALVVINQKGNIRTLCDYKTGISEKINPNRYESYRSLWDELYYTNNVNQERQILGNRCLLRMDNGPASTFKPILYSAVTSQYNFGWENLTFAKVDDETKKAIAKANGEDWAFEKFGGKKVRFTVGNNNLQNHNNVYYLSQSTNTYNSLIVELGSFDKSQISSIHKGFRNKQDIIPYFKAGASVDITQNFPLLNYAGQTYHITHFPKWENYESLISNGFWYNFKFPTKRTQLDSNGGIAQKFDDEFINNSKSSNKIWCMPESSHFFLVDREVDLTNAISQPASGAYPINTTPFKMAEMAGKLFSFNRNFQASIWAKNTSSEEPYFEFDKSWGSKNALSAFYSNNIFEGMFQTIQKGTASDLLKEFTKKYEGEYYFYAKTGTISGNRVGGGLRDKHLMLIISKNKLNNRSLTAQQLRNNQFYVLYFSFFKESVGGEWSKDAKKTIQTMIKSVIDSHSFQMDMS